MITQGQAFETMTDRGFETAHRQIATCPHTGETQVFATTSAARYWLWLISERYESEAYRKRNQA